MVKRIISVLMALVMCMTFTPTVLSVKELPSKTDDKANETFEHETYKIPVSDEYMEKMYGAPEEVLNGTTQELLDYFLDSMFLDSHILPMASSEYVVERQKNADYRVHAAFRELLTRSDLTEVLANSVRNVYCMIMIDEYETEKLHSLVTHIPEDLIEIETKTDNVGDVTGNSYTTYSMSSFIGGAYFSAPTEILESSTKELLEYFRETFTTWMGPDYVISHSSVIPQERTVNYYNNEAFCELITRADLGEALLKDLSAINKGEYVDESITRNLATSAEEQIRAEREKLIQLVNHMPDDAIIRVFANMESDGLIDFTNVESRSGQYVGSMNGVDYYTTNPIITVNGNSVEAFVADGELPINVYARYLATATNLGVDIRDYPTGDYNCHSFAWYDRSYDNLRWIDYITGFLNDAACTQISFDYIQEGDIIVYYDEDGRVLHSGIVYEINEIMEELVVSSKWGQGVACIHNANNVPNDYLAISIFDRDGDGIIEEEDVEFYVNAEFYRYPVSDASNASAIPYEDIDDTSEIIAVLPINISSVISGDDESAE